MLYRFGIGFHAVCKSMHKPFAVTSLTMGATATTIFQLWGVKVLHDVYKFPTVHDGESVRNAR